MKLALCAALVGCSFTPGSLAARDDAAAEPDAPTTDTATDVPLATICDAAAGLLVCYSFDAPAFGATLDNEGSADVVAELTNVTRSNLGSGGAAEVTPASKIFIPPSAELTNTQTLEMWVRVDVAPAAGGRIGMLDADVTSSAMSFFYYQTTGGVFQLRFEIKLQLFLDRTITLGDWIYLAEVCDNGTLIAYLDGATIGNIGGCTPGEAMPHGIIVGANNNQGGNKDAELTGAIDAFRLWTTPRSAQQICAASERTDC